MTLILQYEVYKIKRDLNNLVGNHSSCQCDVKSCNDRKSEKLIWWRSLKVSQECYDNEVCWTELTLDDNFTIKANAL